MFKIRRIYDSTLVTNRTAIQQVKQISRKQFPRLNKSAINKITDQLQNPFRHGFRIVLFIAEDAGGDVKGFAILSHEPQLKFCFLDYISAAPKLTGRGIGGALYTRLRQEARLLKTIGLFFECLPDDPKLSRDPIVLKENRSRLKFYEGYGARPIVNTLYETPLNPGDDNPPYLVYDPAGYSRPLRRVIAKKIVRAILEGKYQNLCPESYIKIVVNSFKDDPVMIRPFRYVKKETLQQEIPPIADDQKIILYVNDKHEIHHIRERGYVESPARISVILKGIESTGLFERRRAGRFSEKYIRAVHKSGYVEYLHRMCEKMELGKTIYPYVFPLRNQTRPPLDMPVRAGYYCMDTFTPIHKNVYIAARKAVDCALSGAKSLLEGYRLSYALVRPPGHHAERSAFGGFCYFNSVAVAANYLSEYGRVAILDIDYHHGNGQEDIFYERQDVLTISIHGNPKFAYPYFSGFKDSTGLGIGEKYNLNLPLPENVDGEMYAEVLKKAIKRIQKFFPYYMVVALGLDSAKGDPTGTWNLTAKDFQQNGQLIGSLRIPILVVQEGGYNQKNLGRNARAFFQGLWNSAFIH
jgi:acetoin utilization deacetylase AcuC-like enzyme/GNAT superfamily N-acetyltransferase